jgi:3-dehydroquinate synthase
MSINYTRGLTRIQVRAASRTYDVLLERGLLHACGEHVRQIAPTAKVFVVSSEPIVKLWGNAIDAGLGKAGLHGTTLTIPNGETAKRLNTVEKLALQMVAAGADRHSVVLAVGGGVAGDVGGFLASIFMRGIPVIQVPTTLVAQVDSAIGGKTGVNLTRGKNLIGTFHQPSAVLVDPDVLATLPEREYRSGLFEAMKYGVIRNAASFDLMESNRDALLRRDGELLERLIGDCIQVKADVVSADEREGGERRILNFGHTIGHTLEAATKYKQFLHGEAVGWGMIAAAIVGREMGITDQATATRIIELVRGYGDLPPVSVSGRRVLNLLQSDKKTVGGVPHFVLARSIGQVEVVNTVTPKVIQHAVRQIARLSQS